MTMELNNVVKNRVDQPKYGQDNFHDCNALETTYPQSMTQHQNLNTTITLAE